jgi:hypothetical protein
MKKTWILVVFCLLFLIRFAGLHQMLADDEGINVVAVAAHPFGDRFFFIPHPPTVAFVYSLGGFFWGALGVRVICLLVGLASILLTYHLAKRLHGETAALFAAGILLVSFWHIFDSVQINVENVFSITVLLVTISYMQYLLKPNLRRALTTGILLGLCFLTKYSAVLIAAAIGIYAIILWWKKERKFSLLLQEHALLFGVAAAMLITYMAIAVLSQSPFGLSTVQHGAVYLTGFLNQNYLNLLSILIQAIFFMSPLLLGLFLLACRNYEKKDRFLYVLIVVFIVFYLFIMSISFRAFERFWAPLMPALAILGGVFLAKLKLKIQDWKWIGIAAISAYAILLLLEFVPGHIYPLYPKSAYIARVLHLQWNFYVPFHSSTGPFGFFVQFAVLVIGFIMAALALLGYFLAKKKKARYFLLVFLGIGLAYNAIMIQEYLFSPVTPSLNKVGWEVNDYVHANIPTTQPVAAYQRFGNYLLRQYDLEFFGYDGYDDPVTNKYLLTTNRTLVIVDYPVIPKDTQFWQIINACPMLASFDDKGVTLGYVFDCSKRD